MEPRDDHRAAELAAMREVVVPLEERVAKLERDYLELGIELSNLLSLVRMHIFKEP